MRLIAAVVNGSDNDSCIGNRSSDRAGAGAGLPSLKFRFPTHPQMKVLIGLERPEEMKK